MSDEKKDDFWNSTASDDSFWKQSVDKETFQSENPYLKSHVHTDIDWTSQQEAVGYDVDSFSEEKKPPFFTPGKIICFVFFLIAVMSIVVSVVFTKSVKQQAIKKATTLNFTEEQMGETISIYDNSLIILPEYAYTIASRETFTGFPEGLQLIAVPFQIESDTYKRDCYPLQTVFVGFAKEGEEELYFKEPAREDLTSAYLLGYDFKNNYRYQGNGYDATAFAFFLVPEELTSCTLYLDKKGEHSVIDHLETRYYKTLPILPRDEELIEGLNELARKGDF